MICIAIASNTLFIFSKAFHNQQKAKKKKKNKLKNLIKVLSYLQFLKNTKYVRITLNHF